MNLTELNNELLKTREALSENGHLTRQLEHVTSQLRDEQAELEQLREQFQAEDRDVRRLEGLSLMGVIYTVLGSKETRLEAERQEMLAAQLKYNNAGRRVAALLRDSEDLRSRLAGMKGLQARYTELLAEKERLLLSTLGETAQALTNLSTRLADARAQLREIKEALDAGRQASAGLDKTIAALESAKGWGTWDILGGGVVTDLAKHARLDEAHQSAQEVQVLLQRFERELADVNGQFSLEIPGGGLEAFADIFIDSLLVDLLVQSRIDKSLNAARDVADRMKDLLRRLAMQYNTVERQVSGLEAERDSLLLQVSS